MTTAPALGIPLAAAATLYAIIVLRQIFIYQYHLRRVDSADTDSTRRHITLLISMEQYDIARDLYTRTLGDGDGPDESLRAYYPVLIALVLIPVGGILAEGMSAVTGPPLQNIFVSLGLVIAGSGLIAVGHITRFRMKKARTDPDDLTLLETNLEAICAPNQ